MARAAAKAAKGEAAVALEDDSNEETDPTKYYENRVRAVRVVVWRCLSRWWRRRRAGRPAHCGASRPWVPAPSLVLPPRSCSGVRQSSGAGRELDAGAARR